VVGQIHYALQDGIAVITLDRPPGNVLTKRLRGLLADKLRKCCSEENVNGIVLSGAGRGFCPGVDLTEYNGPLGSPWVSELCEQIETCDKPVVAALHGGAMGAGLELALAAHARVAHRDTRLAMPDLKLGMILGGGATQRLPRLLGAQRSLEILLSGQVMRASDPQLGRLINQLTDTSPVEAAVALARSLAQKGAWSRTRDAQTGFSDPDSFQAALSAIRAQLHSSEGASADILRCVEAAQLLPFEQGVAFEAVLFEERLSSAEARGARHFLMAEKFATVVSDAGRGQAMRVRRITLMGKPERLRALAVLLLQSDYGVSLICATKAEVDTLGATIARDLQGELKRGRIDAQGLQNCLALLEYKHGLAALGNSDLVIE
jgi:3-hydroxyacyl-CoA dehydrogenase